MSAALDVRDLLTIDVEAEIRKLGRAPLASVEQVPALLVGRAIRAGATAIDVRLESRRIEVSDDAADIDAFRLADLAVLLSPDRSPRERHAALLSLEGAECAALLALASLREASGLRVESGTGGATLEWRRGGRPALGSSPRSERNRLLVEGVRLSRSDARHLLAQSCRFSDARVSVDGEPLPKGFDGVLGEADLHGTLTGRIALPEVVEGDAHVWLLLHGAVMAHTSLPGRPCFEAALELGHTGASAEPAALRAAAEPLAGALASQAIQLLARLARRPARDAGRSAAIRAHVLRASRRVPAAHELRRLPCLPTVPVPGSPVRLLSIGELARLASGSSVVALFPDQDPRDYRAPAATPWLVLDASERSQLDRLTGARFVAPARRSQPSSLQRLAERLRRSARRAADRLLSLWPVTPVQDGDGTERERALLGALRQARPQARTRLCAGAGPVRSRGGTLWLPRQAARVIRAAQALEREGPGFARVAALALLPPGDP